MSTTDIPTKHAATIHFTDGRTVSGSVSEPKFIVHGSETTQGFDTQQIEKIDFGVDLVSDVVRLRSRKTVYGSLAINHDKIIFTGPDGMETVDRRSVKSITFPEAGKAGEK